LAFAWFKDPTILTEFKPLASKIPGVFMSRWLLVNVLAIISFGFVSTAHARDLEVAPEPSNSAARQIAELHQR
jgi:hypothetical protein